MQKLKISREQLFIEVALLFSKRATCLRGQVGCVITRDSRIISTGYNGTMPGNDECSEELCNIKDNCTNSIHAEANAIAFASKHGVSLENGNLFVTTAPCLKCSQLIIQAGIKKVYYLGDYASSLGKDLLIKNNLELIQLKYDDEQSCNIKR